MSKRLLAVALTLGLMSSPLLAGSGMGFNELDEDGDGYLSAEEYMEWADTDGDGQISEEEYNEATAGHEAMEEGDSMGESDSMGEGDSMDESDSME